MNHPWVLIPVKPFQAAKTRLSAVLSKEARVILARDLWTRTLQAVIHSSLYPHILIISQEPEVVEQSCQVGVGVLEDPPGMDLNSVLHYAAEEAVLQGAFSILILPVDLPLLTNSILESLAGMLPSQTPAIAIVPDQGGKGTNVLYQSPPLLLPFQFGPGSFARHREAAEKMGLTLQVIREPSLARDLDLPEDLYLLDMRQSLG